MSTPAASIHEALQRIQAKMKPVKRNRRDANGHAYADLEAVWAHLRPHLKREKIVIVQEVSFDGSRGTCLTQVWFLAGEVSAQITPNEPTRVPVSSEIDALGAITLARRYSLLGLFCLVQESEKEQPEFAYLGATANDIDPSLGMKMEIQDLMFQRADDGGFDALRSALEPLSLAQRLTVLRQCKTAPEVIAEAERLSGGAK